MSAMSTHADRILVTLAIAMTASAAGAAEPETSQSTRSNTFTEVNEPGLAGFAGPLGFAWGDYDGDDDPDIYMGGLFTQAALFRNDPSGFHNATPGVLQDFAQDVEWADYDNDGDADVYLATGGSSHLFRNDGVAGFVDVTSGPLSATAAHGVAWADVDGDQDLDLFIANSLQDDQLLRNDGAAGFHELQIVGVNTNSKKARWGDTDGDGDPDLYVTRGVFDILYRNDAGTLVALQWETPGWGFDPNAKWGDYDNDGDLDLYIAKREDGDELLRNEGSNVFLPVTASPLGTGSDWFGGDWGDYDLDGDLDLYTVYGGSDTTFSDRLLRNDGPDGFTDVASSLLPFDGAQGREATWADYDADGDLDLFVLNYQDGPSRLLRNDYAGSSHWLQVKLVGVCSNVDGNGAKLRVVTSGGTQFRQAGVGKNWRPVFFGLSGASIVDTLEVSWPSGLVQVLTGVVADQRLVVTEGSLPPPICTVMTPNGGESFCVADTVSVEWTGSDHYALWTVNVSTDAGGTWSSVGEGASYTGSGTFSWQVPAWLTTQARVQVTVTNCAGTASDESDTDFTIFEAAPDVVLQSPNGGETFCGGAVVPVDYQHFGCIAESYLAEYSTDSGGTWALIESGPGAGPGTINWTVPSVATTQARVRVTLGNTVGSGSDESDADFSIELGAPPMPVVLTPAASDSLPLNVPYDITWINVGCVATQHWLYSSTDAGVTWAIVHSDSGPGTGTHTWTPTGLPTDQAQIRVRLDNAQGTVSSESGNFVVYGPPPALLHEPAGGEQWVEETDHVISWSTTPQAVSHAIDWSSDGGATWTPIVPESPGAGSGSLVWSVPNQPGSSARVRVTMTNAAGSTSDASGDFTIAALAPFVDVTTVPLRGATSRGVFWVDHNGDGAEDLFVTQRISASLLFENNGLGDFTDVAAPPLDGLGSDSYAAAWSDFDNDGDTDVYIVNNGENRLIRNDGAGFADVTAPPLNDAGNGRAAAWADYDGDGDTDLYLANQLAANRLFRNDGNQTFVDVTASPMDDAGFVNGALWVDADTDGDPDMYIVNFGSNRLVRNDAGVFVDATTGPLGDAGAGYGATWGDMDNDGDPDVYITNNGANVLLRNDPGGFTDVSAGPVDDSGASTGAAWTDVDLDGDLDLYLVTRGGANKLFRNDGGGFVDVSVSPLDDAGSGEGAAWGYVDQNGTPDLYIANAGANRLVLNFSSGANHWLGVHLVGTASNTSGIGARIRVETSGGSQFREVQGGSGYLAQASLTAAFGLGSETIADVVEVTWPSGMVQKLVGQGVDQILTIVEGATSVLNTVPAVSAFRLHPTSPNPFRMQTAIRFEIPVTSYVNISVYDVLGRLVRSVVRERREPGRHVATWAGRDESNQVVASGIYFVRMRAADHVETQRLVLLR